MNSHIILSGQESLKIQERFGLSVQQIDELINLKIYAQDYGVYGCAIAIASNESSAREIIKQKYPFYDPSVQLEVFDIKEGLGYINLGDS